MCVPKSLVKIFVSIGNVMRKRRVKATMFRSFGVRSHQRRGAPPAAGIGSAIYFVPPKRTIISGTSLESSSGGNASGRCAFRRRHANMKIS